LRILALFRGDADQFDAGDVGETLADAESGRTCFPVDEYLCHRRHHVLCPLALHG
jgi:hypothetical protein